MKKDNIMIHTVRHYPASYLVYNENMAREHVIHDLATKIIDTLRHDIKNEYFVYEQFENDGTAECYGSIVLPALERVSRVDSLKHVSAEKGTGPKNIEIKDILNFVLKLWGACSMVASALWLLKYLLLK